jgi:hypothetical protein
MKPFIIVASCLLCVSAVRGQDMPLSQILIPGEGWKKIEVAKVDAPKSIAERALRTVGASGYSYAVNNDKRSLLIMKGLEKVADVPLPVREASALALTPDGGTLLVGDAAGKHVWAYRVDKDGTLCAGEKYITLRTLPYVAATLKEMPADPRSDVAAFAFDAAGRIYAATKFGVQVFDPTGRLCGVLAQPALATTTAMSFGGANNDDLFIICGGDVYSRKLSATAAKSPNK